MPPPTLKEQLDQQASNGQAPMPLELTSPVVISSSQNDYTNGELEDAEDKLGGNMNALLKPGEMPPYRYWMALVWVTLRRTHPEATWEQIRAMKASQWQIGEPPDPLPSDAEPSEPPSSPPSAPSTG